MKPHELPGPVRFAFRERWDCEDFAVHMIATDFTERKRFFLKEIVVEEMSEGGWLPPEPTVTMRREDVQCLFEELWREGFRPTQPKDTEGARQAHLDHVTRLLDAVLPQALRK